MLYNVLFYFKATPSPRPTLLVIRAVNSSFTTPKVNVSMSFKDSPQISTLQTHTNKKDKSIVLSVA